MSGERNRLMVIGVGNPYRNDDAVGLVVARRIRELNLQGVTVIEASGEGASLMEAWQRADSVILIDAVYSGEEPGTIHRFDVHAQSLPAQFFNNSTHSFSVAAAIELARALNRLPQHIIVYGIEGKDFNAGTMLTAEVKEVVNCAIEKVLQDASVLLNA
jgi:hydrogenase maturation protease